MRLRWATSATKAMTRSPSTTAISHGRPAANPARTTANLERKSPKGGSPMRAIMPAAKSPPVTGMVESSPETRPISVVR